MDHIISNSPTHISHTDVLPCPLVSDHDAVYACINIKVTRFETRYKYIRCEKNFNELNFVKDFKTLPFSVIYGVADPDEKLDILNSLITECIERHAPLRRTKITRPPAPWLKDPTIQDLQEQRNVLQANARRSKDAQAWELFRSARNRLKALIKTAKKKFTQKMLSCKKPKEVWKVIHRILHPEPRRITLHPDKLNSHFTSTAERTIGTDVNDNNSYDTIRNMIASLPPDHDNGFHINPVTLSEVVNEIRCLRGDCSTGPDHIPAKMIKIVAEYLGSPLTDIINTCIANRSFPSAWKIARICAIPKVKQITSENDLRPISILPVLSKVYERLIFRQLSKFIDDNKLLSCTISAYRKGQSTTTVMQAIRDDITKAMSRGEVTMMIFADFSKAFDTIRFKNLISKMSKLGFCKDFLTWTLNYVSHRKQYVQIDDIRSNTTNVNFGVPQGSILGPVLFNIYVADLQEIIDAKSYQYADDTTIYEHAKVKHIHRCRETISVSMKKLNDWSNNSSLALNHKKTKAMLFSTQQMSRVHQLENYEPRIFVNEHELERIKSCKLLGVHFNEHLKWDNHIRHITSACYATLQILRKLKHLASYYLRKQLAETLILSKLDYADGVFYPLPQFLSRRLQKVQFATASFVLGRYVKDQKDILEVGWLPVNERRDLNILKSSFKAMYFPEWPEYLKLERQTCVRELRSTNAVRLVVPKETGTFQHSAAKLFNSLPENIRNCTNYKVFLKSTKELLFERACQN